MGYPLPLCGWSWQELLGQRAVEVIHSRCCMQRRGGILNSPFMKQDSSCLVYLCKVYYPCIPSWRSGGSWSVFWWSLCKDSVQISVSNMLKQPFWMFAQIALSLKLPCTHTCPSSVCNKCSNMTKRDGPLDIHYIRVSWLRFIYCLDDLWLIAGLICIPHNTMVTGFFFHSQYVQ